MEIEIKFKKKNMIYTRDNNKRDNYTRLHYLSWEFVIEIFRAFDNL